MHNHRFTPANRVQAFAGFCFNADPVGVHADGFRKVLAHCGNVVAQFRPLKNDRGVGVNDFQAAPACQPNHPRQQLQTVGVLPLWIRIRKVQPDVAFTERAQDRIRQSMRQRVAVRMSFGATIRFDLQATQNQRTSGDQTMRIVTDAYSEHRFQILDVRCRTARKKC